MKKTIIGLCGYAGAGKDTAADAMLLVANRFANAEAARFAFADPMRDMLRALGVPLACMSDRILKERPIPGLGRSYRQLAQTLGTEWGRVCHGEDFWVKALAKRVDESSARIILISDVRFPNEAEWIKSTGGCLARVNRPGVIDVTPHVSEAHVDGFKPDYELNNLGSLLTLQWNSAQLLCRIMSEHSPVFVRAAIALREEPKLLPGIVSPVTQ